MIRYVRAGTCLARVGVHIAYGLSIATVVYPFVAEARRRRLQQRWSRHLLDILGLHLEVSGATPPTRGNALHGLMVANHVSWVDVFVISSLVPATFVCKSEVRRWPLIGTLCAKTGTVFLERGSKFAAQRTHQALTGKLKQGESVALFPEGTTGEGKELLPFRAALLQAAIDAGTRIQPLAIRYLDARGNHATAANYCGATSFWESLCAIAAAPGMTASIRILEPVASACGSRKELAELTHTSIRLCLEKPVLRSCHDAQDENRFEVVQLSLVEEGQG
ncbi:MAG: 1-acyl-sn-glycerol-3-phosphate acyltransferase [Rhodocyclaceae bacterium]|nr:MAG: 1-acyl-sn-glycerol-3-phosphate acyltransferase [Rhodocyclaceae bacterium]